MNRVVLICLTSLLLVACRTKTAPQQPTFLGGEKIDSSVVDVMVLNQQMAEKADQELAQYSEKGYVLLDNNVWVKGHISEDTVLAGTEYISLNMRIYDLRDQLLTIHQSGTMVDKVDDMQAVVQIIPKMNRGDSVSMIVPWYMAFGSAGNQEVIPYENVRVELTIN